MAFHFPWPPDKIQGRRNSTLIGARATVLGLIWRALSRGLDKTCASLLPLHLVRGGFVARRCVMEVPESLSFSGVSVAAYLPLGFCGLGLPCPLLILESPAILLLSKAHEQGLREVSGFRKHREDRRFGRGGTIRHSVVFLARDASRRDDREKAVV